MKNEKFEQEINDIQHDYPNLKIVESADEKYLKGALEIVDVHGKIWDTYQIEIKGSEEFPNGFPKLFETGNSFPKNMDWHVYTEDGSCCVDIPLNEILICKNGISLLDYIPRHVIPYFANQTFRKREGYYLFGEYPHGIFGKIEFYQRKLKASNPKELIDMLLTIIRGFNTSRTADCAFCKKTKFRKCHRDAFMELENIKWYINYDLKNQLVPFFLNNPNFKLPVS